MMQRLRRWDRLLTLGAGLLGLLFLAGCHPRPTMGEAETPADIAKSIDKASMLTRDAQREELAGRKDVAIKLYQQAIQEYHELPAAWNNLGKLMMDQGSNLAAAEAFKTASELSPTDPRPLHNLGMLWYSLGYLDDAQRWFGEALQRDENYQPSLRRSIEVEMKRNKPDSVTLERIRRGLLQEQDPWWQNQFIRARELFEERVNEGRADSGLGG